MYKKELYKIALKSVPLLTLFGLSPIFMLTQSPKSLLNFICIFAISLILILIVWIVNIFLILSFESNKIRKKWEQYLISYLFMTFFISLILIFPILRSTKLRILSFIFYYINAIAQNTAILIISNAIVFRTKKIQADKELTNLKIINLEAEQQQLIQQLQPHFLFNALSTLKYLIKTDRDRAEEYLIKLSDFLRFTVSSHKNKLVALTQELEFTCGYIELQHIRFAGSFSCNIEIPEEEKPQYMIPIYSLQTLVENAIKHNAFAEEEPLLVTIIFKEDSLIVSNHKIPKLIPSQGGVGLQNLNKRYLLICGEEIRINETSDRFEVTLKLIHKK